MKPAIPHPVKRDWIDTAYSLISLTLVWMAVFLGGLAAGTVLLQMVKGGGGWKTSGPTVVRPQPSRR